VSYDRQGKHIAFRSETTPDDAARELMASFCVSRSGRQCSSNATITVHQKFFDGDGDDDKLYRTAWLHGFSQRFFRMSYCERLLGRPADLGFTAILSSFLFALKSPTSLNGTQP